MASNEKLSRAVRPETGNLLNFIALLFHLLPKNLVSWLTGAAMRVKLPKGLAKATCAGFASVFRLDLAEAEHGLDSYATIEDVFTRRLKPGARPIVGPICSPADGYLARSEPAIHGQAVQAKGLDYSLAELIGGRTGAGAAPAYVWYQTIYLAPHNYHRVHAPFSGRIESLRYVPGQLWPVNLPFVLRIPRLFARNERLVFNFILPGGGRAAVVMVGALNVGRIVSPLAPDLVTNALARQTGAEESFRVIGRDVEIGDELGTFMLGSTVIIAYDERALSGNLLVQAQDNRPILMGQTLIAP